MEQYGSAAAAMTDQLVMCHWQAASLVELPRAHMCGGHQRVCACSAKGCALKSMKLQHARPELSLEQRLVVRRHACVLWQDTLTLYSDGPLAVAWLRGTSAMIIMMVAGGP